MLAFGNLLDLAGIDRSTVRLLRHQDNRHAGFPTPHALWRDHRERFEAYQETQSLANKPKLRALYWASFVGVPERKTIFVGLYAARLLGPLPGDRPHPITGGIEPAGSCDMYQLDRSPMLADYADRLWLDWGDSYRTWIQHGDGKAKPVVELRRTLGDPPFPGFAAFIANLSDIERLPATWQAPLSATRGIYLLTCPTTREQYVGMASGVDGFIGRWRE